ncbi:MAG: CBS domain-containing membrane protein [Kiritimatiellia bacterium]|jgi:CBS domain-containing membrane protein
MDRIVDLMSTHVVSVQEDWSLSVALDMLDENRIRHLPVVDEDGNLTGLLSHRDLARRALGLVDELPLQERRAILDERVVSEIMEHSPETADPSDTVLEVAERMVENKFGCMLVVEGRRLVGIITESDFVRLVLRQAEASA